MNMSLWKTCGYVCAKTVSKLWINSSPLTSPQVHTQVTQELSTANPQGLLGVEALCNRCSAALLYLSTATTSTTLYISKLIY